MTYSELTKKLLELNSILSSNVTNQDLINLRQVIWKWGNESQKRFYLLTNINHLKQIMSIGEDNPEGFDVINKLIEHHGLMYSKTLHKTFNENSDSWLYTLLRNKIDYLLYKIGDENGFDVDKLIIDLCFNTPLNESVDENIIIPNDISNNHNKKIFFDILFIKPIEFLKNFNLD